MVKKVLTIHHHLCYATLPTLAVAIAVADAHTVTAVETYFFVGTINHCVVLIRSSWIS